MSQWESGLDMGKSISDKVTDTLRQAIIMKKLSPGERLVEAKLAKELNVSITPVRHAFSQLAKEGLINVFPFKGTYVVEITTDFVKEVGSVRKMVETEAAALAFENLTEEDCQTLERCAHEMERVYHEESNLYETNKLDVSFHQLFYQKSNHKLLMEIWELIKPRILLMQSYGRIGPIPKGRILERHMAIVRALRTWDKKIFCDSVANHLETGHSMVVITKAITEGKL